VRSRITAESLWNLSHLHIFDTLQSTWIKTNVSEFLSPTFRSQEMYYFMLLLFAGLFCVVSADPETAPG